MPAFTFTVDIKGIDGSIKPLTEGVNDLNASLDISYVVLDGKKAGFDEEHVSRVTLVSKVDTTESLEAKVVIHILRQIYGRCLAYDLPVINGLSLRLNRSSKNKLNKLFKAARPVDEVCIRQVGMQNLSIGATGERFGGVFVTYQYPNGGLHYQAVIEDCANVVGSRISFKDAVRKAISQDGEDITFDAAGEEYLDEAYSKWWGRK